MNGATEQIFQQFVLRVNLSEPLLLGAMLLIRIVPIVLQTPFLGGKLVPTETRIGLSVGLAFLVWPYAPSGMTGPLDAGPMTLIVLMGKELFIGFTLGFLAAELFYFMEVAGRALDVMRGSNMAEVQVPELQLRASPVGQFNFQLLLVVFCALNGHGYFIESVIESFRLVPVDGWPAFSGGFAEMVDLILTYTASLFKIAFALVFPALFASFLVDVVFGMFNRIAPQLNAYFMAMGVKAMGGLVMFFFCMYKMADEMARHLAHSLLFVRRIVTHFG